MQIELQEIKNDIYLVWKYLPEGAQADALRDTAQKIDKLIEKELTK